MSDLDQFHDDCVKYDPKTAKVDSFVLDLLGHIYADANRLATFSEAGRDIAFDSAR